MKYNTNNINRVMRAQSGSDTIIVRVRGPWGTSRIKCHKNDSVADLKRYTSERVLGLPRSSTSIAFFCDQHCSQLYHGDDSSTLRRLNIENGDVLYAQPLPNNENAATTGATDLDSHYKANGNSNVKLTENNNSTSTSNLSNSRLLVTKNAVSKDFAASLTIKPSLDPGKNGTWCLIDGSLKILANDGFSKTAQNINRRTVHRNKNSQESNNHNQQYSSKHFIDPAMNRSMFNSFGRPVILSWGSYLKSRGWSAGNNNCFAFNLDATPKAQVIRRGGAPNTIPQSISLKKQNYRHVDYVEFFNLGEINNFVSFWLDHGMLMQRIGILYGIYENDENTNDTIVLDGTKNNVNNNYGLSTKVVIHGIYEPPQSVNSTGGVQLLADPDEANVNRILKAAGLERVGWVFTHPPRNQAITALEAHLMAKFQNRHLRKDEITGLHRSQFVSLTITKNVAGKIVPRAYMVSDQGMVLERSKLWAKGTDLYNCKLTKSLPGKILPAVIRGDTGVMSSKTNNRSLSSQQVLTEFEPGLVLVPIPCGQVRLNPVEPAMVAAQRYQSRQLFYHAKFPVENRAQYGEIQDENNVRIFLLQNAHQTMEQRVSDFHLLLCLSKLFTIDVAISIAKSIGKKCTLDDYCRAVINAFMKHKIL